MNLLLSEEQRLLQETLSRLFREKSTPTRVREEEPLGFDRRLWDAVWSLGVPGLRVPEESGASLMHALLAAEEGGRHLVSIPLVESIAAQRLLALLRVHDRELPDIAFRRGAVVSIALQDLEGAPAQMLPSGSVADVIVGVIGGKVWIWSGLERTYVAPVHGSIPACPLNALHPAHRQCVAYDGAAALLRAAIEEWQLLNGMQIVAAGMQAVSAAAAYATEREAFGRRIGEFQAVSHPLADALTHLEGARLLCWRAADAIAREQQEASALVAQAAWWAGHAARPAVRHGMRVFGGYGMTMEIDAQLYFRRVNAWSLCMGAPDDLLDRVAARLWLGEHAELPDAGKVEVDFSWGDEAETQAARMRAICAQRDDAGMQRFMRESLDGFDLPLQKMLAQEGLLYPDAPAEFGGPGHSLTTAAAVRDAYGDHYWNLLAPSVTDMVAKTILHFGTDQARKDILPLIYAGKSYCTLGYSEPSGGSDIFAARTTATRQGDEWVINGQKMFTSTAHLSDYALLIARTGPDKLRGLTVFIVPLRQAGFAITEIKTIGDERTNVTFFSDVRVPDAYRIGEVNGGLKVLAAALVLEQSTGDLHVMSLKYLLRGALDWATTSRAASPEPMQRSEVRRTLARTAVCLSVQDALNRRNVWGAEQRLLARHHGPMAKLFGSEAWQECSARLLEVAAPESLLICPQAAGVIEFMLRRAIPSTIYAGTSEVQRSLIAESGLGMPRSR